MSDMRKRVILAGKRVSSAMDGKLKSIHGLWIHAGLSCPAPQGVNANPFLADWSGTNSSGTNLHLPDRLRAGTPGVTNPSGRD
ncbi:MAG: hypothetical protein PHY16_16035 [Methylobacter sp.]|nr:hypothetical protein [Methylobacter sp.]